MGKKLIGIAVIVMMLFGVFGLTACGSTQGIPHGTYHMVKSASDKATHKGLEYAWQIREDEAEYLYSKYKIVEESAEIFFMSKDEEAQSASKYKIEFDKKTKVLTVFMPSDMPNADPISSVIVAFFFKRV